MAVTEGRLPVARGVRLSGQDRFVADVIERLMCDLEVDVPAVARRRGANPSSLAYARPMLDALEADGLIVRSEGRVAMTERGRPFLRAAAAAFDPGVTVAAGRHARIV
jgi:oxygen-independent coproporphyrinogen-3 oxidase